MRIFFYIIVITLLSSCTIFKKEISRPVTVYVDQTTPLPHNNSNGIAVKYIGNVSDQAIGEGFMKNFLQEGANTKNVTLVQDENSAEFTLKLVSFDITENSKSETINDSKSPNNGQQVVLNSVDCSVSYKLILNKNKNKNLMTCSNIKSRSEKLKNNRDAGDLLFGTNKDRSQYRTKLMSDDICLNLAEDVGRRIWVPITRRIAKNLKTK